MRFAAVAGAVGVNVLLLWGLAWLNEPATVAATPSPRIGVVLRPERRPAPPSPPPVVASPGEPEIDPFTPTVVLEAPPPAAVEPSPVTIDVSLELPAISPVRVEVRSASDSAAVAEASAAADASAAAEHTAPAPRSAGEVDQPPRERPGNPQPRYPVAAIRREVEGSVRARLLIDEAGRVREVEVLDVRGHARFREAVLAVVRQWRFEPAVDDGRPVPVYAIKQFRFELETR